MAKLTGAWHGRRPPSTGRSFYVRELRGQLIVCKWPVRRGRPLHPTTREQNEKFKQANWLAKYAPAAIQMAQRIIVEGTQLLPRDLMIAAMYGRGLTFHIPPGRRRYPIAAIQDLSAALDMLGGEPGDVLARGPELWTRSRPTEAGQILTSTAPGQPPTWQTLGPGGGAWTQIEDIHIPADLALNVFHEVAIPTGLIAIQASCGIAFNAAGTYPVLTFNASRASVYRWNLFGTDSAAAFISGAFIGATGIQFYTSAQLPAAGLHSLKVTCIPDQTAGSAAVHFDAWAGANLQCRGSGLWLPSPSSIITSLGFGSIAGVGLKAGTHITVNVQLA